MLRERRARWLALGTACMVVGLAALFAWLRNLPPTDSPPPVLSIPTTAPSESPTPPTARSLPGPQAIDAPQSQSESATDPQAAAGLAAFVRLSCSRCHALAGVGNPNLPLDGVGRRLDAAAIRDWALGTGPAREELSAGTLRAKGRAIGNPEIDILIEHLAQSR